MKNKSYMKIFFLLILCVFLGCNSKETVTLTQDEYIALKAEKMSEYPKSLVKPQDSWSLQRIGKLQIVMIDSCEYIIGDDSGVHNGGIFLSHRGRCKFCKSR